jgi:hypothetical protein
MGDTGVHKEVSDWDTSALGATFQLASLCLSKDLEKARIEALRQIEQGTLSEADLEAWPLFMDLRKEYPDMVKRRDSRSIIERQIAEISSADRNDDDEGHEDPSAVDEA